MTTQATARATARHESTALDDALGFRVHRTSRFLRTHLLRLLAEHGDGITPEQYFVLVRLHGHEPQRQVELAEPTLADPPNVTRLVDALTRRGFVGRNPDPTDRRSWLVGLTPAGRRLAASLQHHAITERRAVFDGFTNDDLDRLESLLDRLDDNLRDLLAHGTTIP